MEPSCLCNRGFQNSIKVRLQVLFGIRMHKDTIYVNHTLTVSHDIIFCIRSAYLPLNNYMIFNDVEGLYTSTFEAERKVCC